jgi:hypothetical protein
VVIKARRRFPKWSTMVRRNLLCRVVSGDPSADLNVVIGSAEFPGRRPPIPGRRTKPPDADRPQRLLRIYGTSGGWLAVHRRGWRAFIC